MSLNKLSRFHPAILTAIFLLFILQVAAGYFNFSLFNRLMMTVLIAAVMFPVVIFELYRLDGEKNE